MILVPRERIEQYTAAGWWGRETLVDAFESTVRSHPEREAVVDPPNLAALCGRAPRRLTYAALAAAVERLAGILSEQGIGRDAIVCTQLPNSVDQVAVYLALARLGAVITPVPVQFREHEIAQVFAQTAAHAAITVARLGRHEHSSMFTKLAAPSLQAVFAFGDDLPAGVIALDRVRPSQSAPRPRLDANDVLTLCWTSGTEAAPKAVPRSHNEWLIVTPSIVEGGALTHGARILNPFPLVNMAGFSTGFATWLALGGTLVQHHPFDLEVFLVQLRTERIDYTVAAPAILNRLLQEPRLLEGVDLRRLHRIGSGAAPLSEWMVREFDERHGVAIVNYFGSNEGAALTGAPQDIPDAADRATYFPRAGVPGFDWSISTTKKIRTRLVDPDTEFEITEPGKVGELRFAGPTIFSGYYRAPELTARAFDDARFYRTGDLFEIGGARGEFYRYVGRSKDIVNRGGMKISSEEIENLILAHPAVAEAAIVGIPDAALGERVGAFVVTKPGATLTLDALVRFLRDERRVAAFKLPERLELVTSLPRNAVGKILKRALRDEHQFTTGPS